MNQEGDWFRSRTDGAPGVLLSRVQECLASTATGSPVSRLADAGEAALAAAIRRGTGREAALDLLAADALITLALLEAAERDPASLGRTARRLRDAAAGVA